MTTVSLKDLASHLGDASKLIDAAMDSSEAEPELDFEAMRQSLRSALGLLGEGSGPIEPRVKGEGAADSALRGRQSLAHSVAGIFPTQHPYRNNAP
jgi:hypothetical protein